MSEILVNKFSYVNSRRRKENYSFITMTGPEINT